MNKGNKGTKKVRTVWMLMCEDLTELGEMSFTLWEDRESALAAMEKDIRETKKHWGKGTLERRENGATLEARHDFWWDIYQKEVKGMSDL